MGPRDVQSSVDGAPGAAIVARAKFQVVGLLLTMLLLALVPTRAGAQAELATDADVREAMELIQTELLARRDERTHWEQDLKSPNADGVHNGGQTALAVLSLLYAGMSPQQGELRQSIEWLSGLDMTGVYARSLRASVWAQLPPSFLPRLEEDAEWIKGAFSKQVDGWSYRFEPSTQRMDNSTTQYGCLGLWEASKRGLTIAPEYWRRLEERFIDNQLEDGGWTYGRTGPARGSMTAAGLTVLFLTRDLLHAEDFAALGANWPGDAALQAGLAWMVDNFDPAANPGYGGYYTYYLYGVERVGLASGFKYFGDLDWFRTGATALIDELTTKPRRGERQIKARASTVDLAFGLLFLSRGRAPVAINKLRIDELPWNNRPRDAAALTTFVSEETEQALNWQVVPIDADPASWLDAPLLYLASQYGLPFASESPQAEKLRWFALRGGMILAIAEGGGRDFRTSVERLSSEMFPEWEWRRLSEEHEIFRVVYEIDSPLPEVWGLSNGVRELVLLLPQGDLTRVLQMTGGEPGASKPALKTYHLLANIVHYAAGMEPLKPRLASFVDEASDSAPGAAATPIGHARYGGNWNPEPFALAQYASWARRQTGRGMAVQHIDLDRLPKPGEVPLVVVSGIEQLVLSEAEISSIERFANEGGTMLFETTGGLGKFAGSIERQLSEHFRQRSQSLSGHPIVTGEGLIGGSDCRTVNYTAAAWLRFGTIEHRPRLRGIAVDGQIRLILSGDDLSHALLDRPVWGVCGYDTASARRLLGNILAFAGR